MHRELQLYLGSSKKKAMDQKHSRKAITALNIWIDVYQNLGSSLKTVFGTGFSEYRTLLL